MEESFPKSGANYEDIDNWARKAFADIESKYYEDERPLPAYLYHVTTHANAKEILENGLMPSKLLDSDRPDAVSLTDDMEYGKRIAAMTQGTEDLVVLRIYTSQLDRYAARNCLRAPNPNSDNIYEQHGVHEIHYEDAIPPQAISVVRLSDPDISRN